MEGNISRYRPLPVYASHSRDEPMRTRLASRLSNRLHRAPIMFRRAARNHQVKLLHAHFGPLGIEFLPVAKTLRLPLLTSFLGWDASSLPQDSKSLRDLRRLFHRGDAVLVVSSTMKLDLIQLGCPEEKITVHHCAVDMDRFVPGPPNLRASTTKLLSVCNFTEKKGLRFLIQALPLVRERYPDASLRIVGKERDDEARSEKRFTENLIHELGLTGVVTIAGPKHFSEIHEEYRKSDIFVLPSVTARTGEKEGIPVALMEAQACGLPVVSTLHAGIPEAVVEGKSGYLVPERDVKELSDAICLVLSRRTEWPTMGQYGREHIDKHFNLATQIDALGRIYTRLLAAAP